MHAKPHKCRDITPDQERMPSALPRAISLEQSLPMGFSNADQPWQAVRLVLCVEDPDNTPMKCSRVLPGLVPTAGCALHMAGTQDNDIYIIASTISMQSSVQKIGRNQPANAGCVTHEAIWWQTNAGHHIHRKAHRQPS